MQSEKNHLKLWKHLPEVYKEVHLDYFIFLKEDVVDMETTWRSYSRNENQGTCLNNKQTKQQQVDVDEG